MSYSKAGKAKDFTASPSTPHNWHATLHTALVVVCFAFVSAVILGFVP